ncbi:hypothetical protein FIBSPDRAFT_960710 [Athelia psychrophila]|uniref:YWTD domain-containing protein n=1 Tax=Athelia psychrophila TaxID=1759441 RepID=A0A166C510_9AGAM|nr:hypothetical protein FIBSPDRAFT_960710 [Fibularhizoctonia sp. CBS 109695]
MSVIQAHTRRRRPPWTRPKRDPRWQHVLASGISTLPDDVVVDTSPGKGHSTSTNNEHTLRAAGDGSGVEVIVLGWVTFTPKQLVIDTTTEKLHWTDREGMRVMRCGLDGADVETFVCNGETPEERKDGPRRCVGVAVDTARGLLYWTQKGASEGQPGRKNRYFRLIIPRRAHGHRNAVRAPPRTHRPRARRRVADTLLKRPRRPARSTTPTSPPPRARRDCAGASRDTVVAPKFHKAIGLLLDLLGRRAFVPDLNGSVYAVPLESGGGGVDRRCGDTQIVHCEP